MVEKLPSNAGSVLVDKLVHAYYQDHGYRGTSYEGMHAKYADIAAALQPFVDMPDSGSMATIVSGLDGTLPHLSYHGDTQLNDLITAPTTANIGLVNFGGSSQQILADWDGDAAKNFVSGFVAPFGARTQNQYIMAAVLKRAAQLHGEMWDHAHDSAVKLYKQACAAADSIGGISMPCKGDAWSITFTVIASVTALVLLPELAVPTGIGLASAGTKLTELAPKTLQGIGTAGAASQVIAGLGPDENKKARFSNKDADTLAGEIRKALQDLTNEVNRQQQRLAAVLRVCAATVHGNKAYFEAPYPNLAHAGASTIFNDDNLGLPD